jgi:hypothetical protein
MLAAVEIAYGRKIKLWMLTVTEWVATGTVPRPPAIASVAQKMADSRVHITPPAQSNSCHSPSMSFIRAW